MPAKETPKTQKSKPRSRVKASAVTQRPTYAEVCQQLAESLRREKATAEELQNCRRQLTEAFEQQARQIPRPDRSPLVSPKAE
jgi:hypothetical protein